MNVDNYYKDSDKSQFYLGVIAEVNAMHCILQVENITLLTHRKIRNEVVNPSTINYFVIVESIQGLFLGQVYQIRIPNSDNVRVLLKKGEEQAVYPTIFIDIIGEIDIYKNRVKHSGIKTVGISDKVYVANSKIIQIYLDSIVSRKEEEIEEHLAIGNYFGSTSEVVKLTPNTLFDRHMFVIGTTNSGKSTSALTIISEMINKTKKVLLIDPTGEYENSFRDGEVDKIKIGDDSVINTSSLSYEQWAMLFDAENTQIHFLTNAIKSLKYQNFKNMSGVFKKIGENELSIEETMNSVRKELNESSFDLKEIHNQLSEEEVAPDRDGNLRSNGNIRNTNIWLKNKVKHKIDRTNFLDFFEKTDESKKDVFEIIEEFMNDCKKSLYINTSGIEIDDTMGSIIIDLIGKYVLKKTKKEHSPFIFFVDEIHRYTKGRKIDDYQNAFTLISREGRKKGVFLFLTTQNPQDVPEELLGQMGTLLIHRLTHRRELSAIENFLSKTSFEQIPKLGQGEAILTSANLIRDLHISIFESSRQHENNTPVF